MKKESFIELYSRMEQSDNRMSEFLKIEQIPYSKFYYWKRKYMGSIKLSEKNNPSINDRHKNQHSAHVNIYYPNGVRATIELPLDANWIRTMILV